MNKKFEQNGYCVIREFLPKDFCKFIQSYFKVRQDALDYVIDEQCPKSKSFYADPLIETILLTSVKKLSETIEVELLPTYSYTRIYSRKEYLFKHTDRPECQFSATLSLGYPEKQGISPIFMKKEGKNASKLELDIGDICIYRGDIVEHWREPFTQDWYLQAFLHYVDKNGPYANRIYDGRFALATEKI